MEWSSCIDFGFRRHVSNNLNPKLISSSFVPICRKNDWNDPFQEASEAGESSCMCFADICSAYLRASQFSWSGDRHVRVGTLWTRPRAIASVLADSWSFIAPACHWLSWSMLRRARVCLMTFSCERVCVVLPCSIEGVPLRHTFVPAHVSTPSGSSRGSVI